MKFINMTEIEREIETVAAKDSEETKLWKSASKFSNETYKLAEECLRYKAGSEEAKEALLHLVAHVEDIKEQDWYDGLLKW